MTALPSGPGPLAGIEGSANSSLCQTILKEDQMVTSFSSTLGSFGRTGIQNTPASRPLNGFKEEPIEGFGEGFFSFLQNAPMWFD